MTIPQRVQWCAKAQKILALLLVGAIAVFYFAFYRPSQKRLAAVTLEMAHTSLNIQSNQDAARDLPDLRLRVKKLQNELASSRNLPETADVPQFMRAMTDLSQRANLAGFNCTPQIARSLTMCREMPISLQFSGDFGDVAGFLLEAEEIPRLMRLRHLSVKHKDDQNGNVDVELVLSLYYADTK